MSDNNVTLKDVKVEWKTKKDNRIGIKIGETWYSQFIHEGDDKRPATPPELVDALTMVRVGDKVNLEAIKVGSWWNITALTVVWQEGVDDKPKFDKSPKGFSKTPDESSKITRMSCLKSAVETMVGGATAWDAKELVDRIIEVAKRYEQFVITGE